MPKDFAPIPLSELKTHTNGEFYDDEFSKGRYSTDASIYQIKPLAVFIPKSKDDVIKSTNKLQQKIHPDVNPNANTERLSQIVNEAKETILKFDFS